MKFAARDPEFIGKGILERVHAQAAKLIRSGEFVGIAHVSLEDFETLITILNHRTAPGWSLESGADGAWIRMLSCGRQLHVWPRADLAESEVAWADKA